MRNNRKNNIGTQLSTTLLAACLAVFLPVAAQAQRPQQDSKDVSVSKVERLNRAPVSKEILRVTLPKPQEFTLSNGLTVLVIEDHRFPTVTLQLRIEGAGGLFQPADNLALASAAMALNDTGTKTRTSKQMAEEQDRLGMILSGGAGISSSSATLNASGLSDNFDEWFELFSDALLNPTFPEEEIRKYVQRQKAQLRQFETLPFLISIRWFNKAVFGKHRLHRILPSGEELESLTPEALSQWHRERYAPQNAILGVAGDVDTEKIIAKLEAWAASWPGTDRKVEWPEGPTATSAKRVYLIHRPGSVQTSLRMGNLAMERKNPDYYATRVLNRILGQGPASRLFLNIREEKGYTYGVSAGIGAGRFLSPWQASSDVRTEVTEGAMEQFFYEFYRIRNEPVPETELEEAKRALVARFALQLERPRTAISNEITRRIYGFPADYWDTYPARIMDVTAEDVQRVARKYMNLNNIQIVAVGDAGAVAEVLAPYGTVEAVDTDGNPLDLAALAAEKEAEKEVASGPPAAVAGKWELTMETPRGGQKVALTLEQDGSGLKGTFTGPAGNATPVTGTIKGQSISFTMTRQTPRGEMSMDFSGTVDGDSMKGQVQILTFSQNWTAKRLKEASSAE